MKEEHRTVVKIAKTLYPTTNTKLAAALLTVGVPFADPGGPPLSNIYCEERPYRAGMPGRVTYHLGEGVPGGPGTAELAEAFASGHADAELDQLVERVASASPELGQRIKEVLPRALVRYCRGALENRERLLDLWKKAEPMVLVRKGGRSFALVSRRAPEAILRHCGLK